MKIVLVHGIFDDGRLFKKMAAFLNDLDCDVYIPSLKPADARLGVADLSHKLKAYIDSTFEPDESFVLIGFSLGCLISRYYLQELGGHDRCNIFHAISGPHKGSLLAYLSFSQGSLDIRPGSAFIQQLNESESKLAHMDIYSYRTPFDQMIIPSKSSHWELAENTITHALVHRFMLSNALVFDSIKASLIGVDAV
ncbi:MAG: lipase [Pseudomonadales bacterium]|nr:lipase [Pseudomonadales bacterium]